MDFHEGLYEQIITENPKTYLDNINKNKEIEDLEKDEADSKETTSSYLKRYYIGSELKMDVNNNMSSVHYILAIILLFC